MLAIFVTIQLWFGYYLFGQGTSKPCSEVNLTSTPSPDGQWNAEVFDNVCEGHPLATSVATVIRLRALSNQITYNIVSKDEERDRPKVRWYGNNQLEITFSNHDNILFGNVPIPNMIIKVKYLH